MTKTSLADKLNIILEVSKSSKLFIVVIIFIVLLILLALTMNKNNEKNTKKLYLVVYGVIITALLVGYSSSLGKMIDYMMNNFFIAIYFPNLAIYSAAIITSNIIFLVSIFNKKISKLIKNINVIVFAIINYILALILNIIHTENLDVFTQTSVYGNSNAQSLIELSSTIFIIWILFLIGYKIILNYLINKNIYTPQTEVQKIYVEKKKRILPKNIKEVKALDIAKLGTKEIIIEKRERILPTNIKEIKAPRYVKDLPQKEIIIEKRERILPTNIKEIKAPRYVKQLPKIVKQPVQQIVSKPIPELNQQVKPNLNSGMTPQEIDMLLAPAYDKMFSLDDYKKMRNMLVEKQQKQQEKYESRRNEHLKFQQLKDLYEA